MKPIAACEQGNVPLFMIVLLARDAHSNVAKHVNLFLLMLRMNLNDAFHFEREIFPCFNWVILWSLENYTLWYLP